MRTPAVLVEERRLTWLRETGFNADKAVLEGQEVLLICQVSAKLSRATRAGLDGAVVEWTDGAEGDGESAGGSQVVVSELMSLATAAALKDLD